MAAQVTPSVSTKTGEVDDGSLIEVLNFYDNMRKKNLLCDVVLEVQGRLFPAHRLALAAGSHFFFLMFTTGMKEATSGQVELKEVEPDVVEQLIEYIYTKRISLNVRNIQSMLLAADRFLMDPVKRACEEFLEGQLNASNCLGISILADFSNSPELAAVAEEHVLRCFSRVIKSNEFLELDVARLTGLLRKDEVVVSAEEVVFSAAVAWLQHDLPNRRRFSADVLSCVRFHLMSHTFLSKIVHADLPFQNDAACLHMIIHGMQYHMLSWESRRDLAQMSRPRGVKRKPRIAVLRSSVPSLFHFFNPKDSSCTRSSSSFRSRQNAAVVYCDGVVYILGGSSLSGPMKSISCYSIQQDYRFLKSGLPTPCDSPAACVAHGNIYVSGGVTKEGGRILHHLHCFNTHTSSWQTQPNMLTARCGHGSVELNGLIYVCGGLGSNGLSRFITNSCEVYNPSTQQWRELCPMTQPRKDHGLVVVNNLIYAIGGKGQQGFLRSVEYYNVGSNQWCRAPPLPYPMMVRCAAVGNEIYVLAGKSQRAELQNVLEFHVDDNKWTSCCSMKSFPYKDTLICVVD
uniref:Kelch-like family member 7 n=2 Tax=Nothobranchius korthausae TaxID=1143690 RepID=A0A1A8FIF8_9TELE